jgi:hemoglobin
VQTELTRERPGVDPAEEDAQIGTHQVGDRLLHGARTYPPRRATDRSGRRSMTKVSRRKVWQHRPVRTVYEAAGGSEGIVALAHAWHARVLADEVVNHAFSHGYHPQHTERLAAYWVEALGGPAGYSEHLGDETSVVRIHSGHGPHEEMDRRAILCFDQALADVGLDRDERLRQVLHDYFSWATTTTMARYHDSEDDVPDGLPIPRWSWEGLVV